MRLSWVLASVGGGGPYPGFLCMSGTGEVRCRPFSHVSLTRPSHHAHQLHSVHFRHYHVGTSRKGWRARVKPCSHPHRALISLSSRADSWEGVEEAEEEEGSEEEDEGAARVAEGYRQHIHSAAFPKRQRDRRPNDNANANVNTNTNTNANANANASANSRATTKLSSGKDKPNTNESGGSPATAGGAERLFAVARSLHLRRHRSPLARETALRLFRESMLLRPGWKETDSKFAVESGIDEVFAAFAFSRLEEGFQEDESYHGVGMSGGKNGSWEMTGRARGQDTDGDAIGDNIGDTVRHAVNNTVSDAFSDVVGDVVGDAVACLRNTLARVGYTAFRVQERFGPAVGAMGAQRLPGPYYLRKNLDHSHAATVASLGRPRDALDIAIRLFLLGLAFPRADVERTLGSEFLSSAKQLGMLGECPVDPSLLVSLVQLFPLDAEALLSPLPQSSQNDNGSREQPPAAAIDPSEQREGEERTQEGQAEAGGGGTASRVGAGEKAKTAACGMTAASALVFATDWPPPGSTALTEEPVMYIGPDSIGLVQHAPRRITSRSRSTDIGLGEPTEVIRDVAGEAAETDGADVAGRGAAERTATSEGQAGVGVEAVLDLCCGSGVQGIAAAALRGGNAHVTCVDINPRAIRFARFNALLNGLDESRFHAVAGDLYCALRSGSSGGIASSDAVPARRGTEKQTPAAEGDSSRLTMGGTARRKAGGGSAPSATGGRGPEPFPFDDDEGTIAKSRVSAPLLGGGEPTPQSNSASKFDLILVNPPFVPVPPRLDSVRRRYDVFAAGGANGEDVVEGIFRGVMDHLQPGGLLAMVSELANPRVFDTKLRRWVGAQGPETMPPAEAAAAAAVVMPAEGEQTGRGAPENEQRGQEGDAAPSGSSHVSEGGVSPAPSLTAAEEDGGSMWTGVVLHEKVPWTAKEYAARRAGTAREAQGWERHLSLVGVEEMAPGFVFVRRREPPSSNVIGAGDESGSRNAGEATGDVDIEVQGFLKLWAPHNKAAVDNTAAALKRM